MIFKRFKIKELFSITPSNTIGGNVNDDMIISDVGKVPFITNTINNNGLGGYSLYPANNKGNVITLSDTVTSVYETIYYQKNDFIGKSHLQVLKPLLIEDENGIEKELFQLTERIALYIITSMKKSVKTGEFDYGTKFNRDAIADTIIELPVENEKSELPDWGYMDSYIKDLIPKYFEVLDAQVEELKRKNESYKSELTPIINSLI
ncbi:restriction endonuclease subunit S [Viridibacillus sp. NPDC096237]|uniref:restriction endonuclease subunit S n=1 Tax=Viridibacillus sp. NPDC096237 TaxID=3390721 RepID=UPI003D04DA8A